MQTWSANLNFIALIFKGLTWVSPSLLIIKNILNKLINYTEWNKYQTSNNYK